jgi:predicted transcriptional regulator
MQNIQEVFNRIQIIKADQKKIRDSYKNALENSRSYQAIKDEVKQLQDKKKQIESAIKQEFSSEFDKLDRLKQSLEDETDLLSNLALTQYVNGKTVEVKDERDNTYEPIFAVRFKKM